MPDPTDEPSSVPLERRMQRGLMRLRLWFLRLWWWYWWGPEPKYIDRKRAKETSGAGESNCPEDTFLP